MDDKPRHETSEDLIAQAREGFVGLDETRTVSSPPPAPPAEREAPPTSDQGLRVREPRKPEDTVPPGDPFGLPEQDQGPDRPPYPADDLTGATYYEAPPESPLRRFRGLIIVGVILLAGALWAYFDNSKAVEDLTVGDCFHEPSGDVIYDVEPIDCVEPHDYEVFAVVTVAGEDGAPYPGDETVAFDVLDQCITLFDGYVGMAYADSVLYVDTLYPSDESWGQGDREGDCLLAEYDALGRIVPVTGSSRNAAR